MHQDGGVHGAAYAGVEFVVVLDFVAAVGDFKAEVGEVLRAFLGEFAEREVVGGDEPADGILQELAQESQRAVELVDGVGAFEHFVEDDEHLRFAACHVDQLAEAEQFGMEIGGVLCEVVGGAHAGEEGGRAEGEAARVDDVAGLRQHQVHADRAEKGAFACHVRAGDDEEPVVVRDGEVIGDASLAAEEGMPHVLRVEPAAGNGEDVGGVVVAEKRHAHEGIGLGDGVRPCFNAVAVAFFPGVQAEEGVQVAEVKPVEEEGGDKVAPLV